MKILSLGWGVQSFTLAVMGALGDAPKPDYIIHSDTSFEANWTYKFAKEWTPWLKEHGLWVGVAQAPEYQRSVHYGHCSIPAFTKSGDKVGGQIQRKCTYLWKIAPLRKYATILRQGSKIELLIGISRDEATRMRESDAQYITNSYPLVEQKITREDCIKYLQDHNIEVPGKSSCYFCPYHTKSEWKKVMKSEDRDKVIQVDREIRNSIPISELFLSSYGLPIESIDFDNIGRVSYLWDEECTGICGI